MFNAPSKDIPAKVYRIKRNSPVQTVLRTVSETCTSTAHELYCDLQKLNWSHHDLNHCHLERRSLWRPKSKDPENLCAAILLKGILTRLSGAGGISGLLKQMILTLSSMSETASESRAHARSIAHRGAS